MSLNNSVVLPLQSAVLGGEEEEEVCVHDPDPPHTLCVRLIAREDSRGGDGLVWLCLRGPGCSEMLLSPKELLKQNMDVFILTSQFPLSWER